MTSIPGALALAAVCGLLAGVPGAAESGLAYDRQAILAGQVWRAWTGHLVHFTWQHAMVDATVLFVASAVLEQFRGWRAVAWGFFAGAPLVSLALLLAVPGLQLYEGASGIATLFAVPAGFCLWRAEPRLRGAIVFLAIGSLVKLLIDASGFVLGPTTLPVGVKLAWQAHAVGATLGLGFALALAGRAGHQGPVSQPPAIRTHERSRMR